MAIKISDGDHSTDVLATQLNHLSLLELPSTRLEVRTSPLAGAGRGVFATEDIAAGEELFRSEPRVTLVEDSEEQTICDWCHCIANTEYNFHEDGSLKEDHELPFIELCEGCGLVGYCSNVSEVSISRPCTLISRQDCFIAAQEQYHEHECGVIVKIAESWDEWTCTHWLKICRILCMHKMGALSQAQLDSLLALKTDTKDSTTVSEDRNRHVLQMTGEEAAEKVKQMTGSELSTETIFKLFLVVRYSAFQDGFRLQLPALLQFGRTARSGFCRDLFRR